MKGLYFSYDICCSQLTTSSACTASGSRCAWDSGSRTCSQTGSSSNRAQNRFARDQSGPWENPLRREHQARNIFFLFFLFSIFWLGLLDFSSFSFLSVSSLCSQCPHVFRFHVLVLLHCFYIISRIDETSLDVFLAGAFSRFGLRKRHFPKLNLFLLI